MKKRLVCLAMCLCMSVSLVAGCGKKSETKKEEDTKKEASIPVEDDNAEALHGHLMKQIGDYAKKYAKLNGSYDNLQLEVEKEEVITDESVEKEINEMLTYYPFVFEGEVVSGDTVNIDYEGTLNGEVFQGGSAEGYDLKIGSKAFIPGFEAQLIGMKVAETKTITVTFPESYENNKDLAGKEVQFKVTANYLQKADNKAPAQLTEQWISAYLKKAGQTLTDASVNGFKAYVRETLEKYAKETRENNEKYAIVDKLLAMTKLNSKKIPKEQVTFYKDMIRENVEKNITGTYQMTLSQYLESAQMTEKDFEKQIAEIADERMTYEYSLILIGEEKDLKPTEKEYEALLKEYADTSSITVKEFRNKYQADYQLDLYFEAYATKVLDYLLKNATITDVVSKEAVSAE